MPDVTHRFELEPGETIQIGGVPYRYVGGGLAEGGTDPVLARRMRERGDEGEASGDPTREG